MSEAIEVRRFSTREAARLSGLSVHMVDYLCRTAVIAPYYPRVPRLGARRQFLFGHLVLLRTIERLLKKGISVKKIKSALKYYNSVFTKMEPGTPTCSYFITDGVSVYIHDDSSSLIDLNKHGQMTFSFIIDVRKLHSQLSEAVKRVAG